MNYKEAVIVPLEVFNKCNFNPQEKELPPQKTGDILNDKTLPPDVKIKLYNQKKKLTKRPLPEPQLVQIKKEVEVEAPSEDIILNQFPLRTKPVVNLILKYMKDSRGILSWTDNLEIVIEGDTIQDSNLIQLLRFVTNSLTITSAKDIPVGAEDFVDTLVNIGVPKAYIQLPQRSLRKSEWVKF